GSSPATAVVASLPVVIAFLIMQRSFLPELFGRGDAPPLSDEDEDRLQPAAAWGEPGASAAPSAFVASAPARDVIWEAPPAWAAPARGPVLDIAAALAGLRPWSRARAGRLVHCVLIVLCASLVSLTALHGRFLLDDVYRVGENPGV